MNKKAIIDQVILHLESTLQSLISTAKDAKDMATSEESKAENKYDTRGLEASYLASGQAIRAKELADNIEQLKKLPLPNSNKQIQSLSLVHVIIDDEKENYLLLLPFQGGIQVMHEGFSISTLSFQAPLGKQLLGLSLGDEIELNNKHYFIKAVF